MDQRAVSPPSKLDYMQTKDIALYSMYVEYPCYCIAALFFRLELTDTMSTKLQQLLLILILLFYRKNSAGALAITPKASPKGPQLSEP